MACGAPVPAFRQGSASEIIDQGVTGAVLGYERFIKLAA
jgi:hypothetical protein